MFGAETLCATMPNAASDTLLYRIAHKSGLGRTVASNANTTTSVAALLFWSTDGEPRLLIHYNPRAAVPIDHGEFRGTQRARI